MRLGLPRRLSPYSPTSRPTYSHAPHTPTTTSRHYLCFTVGLAPPPGCALPILTHSRPGVGAFHAPAAGSRSRPPSAQQSAPICPSGKSRLILVRSGRPSALRRPLIAPHSLRLPPRAVTFPHSSFKCSLLKPAKKLVLGRFVQCETQMINGVSPDERGSALALAP